MRFSRSHPLMLKRFPSMQNLTSTKTSLTSTYPVSKDTREKHIDPCKSCYEVFCLAYLLLSNNKHPSITLERRSNESTLLVNYVHIYETYNHTQKFLRKMGRPHVVTPKYLECRKIGRNLLQGMCILLKNLSSCSTNSWKTQI